MTQIAVDVQTHPGLRHEAFLYSGIEEFVSGVAAFVRDGISRGEPALVVVRPEKIAALRAALTLDEARRIEFADMAVVGRNPACIIAAWQTFADHHRHRQTSLRGVGEPVDDDRHPLTIGECERHEALLNLAFDGPPQMSLLCPYDTAVLAPDVVDIAWRTHPRVADGSSSSSPNARYQPVSRVSPFAEPLTPPAVQPDELEFDRGSALAVRELALDHAVAAGLDLVRAGDLALALHELAVNAVTHGGRAATLRMWREHGYLHGEVASGGFIDDPLVGRRRPPPDALDGRGLWLANQLCDLVQLSSSSAGTTVRVSLALGGDT